MSGINLKGVVDQLLAAAEAGVEKAAEHVLDVSQRDVPVDKGELKASGRVQATGLKAQIGYTDPISIMVHENMQAQHDNGHAKFLENALNSQRTEAAQIVAEEIRRKLGG